MRTPLAKTHTPGEGVCMVSFCGRLAKERLHEHPLFQRRFCRDGVSVMREASDGFMKINFGACFIFDCVKTAGYAGTGLSVKGNAYENCKH
jgi:hypothetical protein